MQVENMTPLWIAARGLLYERGDDFFRRRGKVLKTFNPDDIHDLRVASRRLREGLALFAPCYPPGNVALLVKQVKRVTRLLGEMRNTDEALIFFGQLRDELAESCRTDLEQQLQSFQKARKKERKRLKTGLLEYAAAPLRDQFLRIINAPSLFMPPAAGVDLFAPLSAFARVALDARLEGVLKLVPDARQAGAVKAQHLLRIAVKHFRYRLEILSVLIGTRFEEIHATVKAYQDVLGMMHDLDVFTVIAKDTNISSPTKQLVGEAIAVKRDKLFADFSRMLKTAPFEMIGEQVRSSL